MKLSASTRQARQRGFTLLEILIALTIGMVLTLVVSQLFIGSRRTYATTDDNARIQENVRYTYQLFTRMVHLAGYKSSPNSLTSGATGVFSPSNPVLQATDGGGTASDTFTVRFQGNSDGPVGVADGSVLDCLGAPVVAGITAVNTFTIGTGANGAPALFCAVGSPAGTPVEVVPNVANMQILYGVDDDANYVAEKYVPAAGVNFENVRSIRFAFLFVSPTASALLAANTNADKGTYDLNGVSVGPFTDHFIRRAVTLTVSLRNRTP